MDNDERHAADRENPFANLDGDVLAGGGAAFDDLENGDFGGEDDHTLVELEQQQQGFPVKNFFNSANFSNFARLAGRG